MIKRHLHQNIETQRLNGRVLADKIQLDLANLLQPAMSHRINNVLMRPGLAVVIVGERRDSKRYVEKKIDAAKQLGFHSEVHELSTTVDQTSVIHLIDSLNNNPIIDGILLQLPLPDHLDSDLIISHIDCDKDVDGLHPTNMGKLSINYRNQAVDSLNWIKTHQIMQQMISRSIHSDAPTVNTPTLIHLPCAARACFELLLDHSVDMKGKHCVILGRSPIVGLPMNLMLLQAHATVTNIDQFLPRDQMKSICQSADVIITAVGKAGLIDRECIKQGAVLLDVGINFVPIDAKHQAAEHHKSSVHEECLMNPKDAHDGLMLVGDVDFESCSGVARAISPVPGGIGPLTVAMLMENTAFGFVQRFCNSFMTK